MVSLMDLNSLRSAPSLNQEQSEVLLKELKEYMDKSDWFTVGIMAPSQSSALAVIEDIQIFFQWPQFILRTKAIDKGPVFLKANQKTREINIRNEAGLGEGFLITCQNECIEEESNTYGPLPLDLFKQRYY